MPNSFNNFDCLKWIREFKTTPHHKKKNLRAEIFQQTVEIVKLGGYKVNNKSIIISNKNVTKSTLFFYRINKLQTSNQNYSTKFSVIEADCLETAKLLIKANYNPCVLNMASRRHPGGGVISGAGAQEENLFRRSNLFLSLFQFVDFALEYGIKRSKDNYPLNSVSGGIYSPGITVFRGTENSGYCLLHEPYCLSIVSVPALSPPDLNLVSGVYRIADSFVELTKEKIRTILRICGNTKHDSIVLSAFGCGAFRNPPNHMAELFKEIFEEVEFKNQFKLIIFAIIDDHNSRKSHNPKGNIIPFLEVFG